METIAASDQRHLRSVAYKLLGSMADAEDMIQETYLRWYRLTPVERAGIDEPLAWQTRVLSRLCIDTLRSARHRKETYVGEWLPEPVPSSASTFRTSVEEEDPLERISVDDSVSMALMIVLDSMTPAQRVAFVLHDIFQYPFPEVAQVVGRSPESCRSLASAARKRIRNATAGQTSREEHRRINRAFKTAWTTGRIDELISLLDPRATAVTDGGGQVSAALEPLHGATAIAEFFADIFRRQPNLEVQEATVNGEPGLLGTVDGTTVAVLSTRAISSGITDIWVIRNPEKLYAWNSLH